MADRGDDHFQAAVVDTGDRVAEADRVAGGEAGGDAHDTHLAAGGGRASAVERGDDSVPVDSRHRGAVADAGCDLDVAEKILAMKEGAVADDQTRGGLVGVDALGCGPQC